MARKPPKKTDHLKDVLKVTLGEEAQERKKHNTRPQPGDVRIAKSDDGDRLDRANKRSAAIDLAKRQEEKEGKPGEGEIFTATSPDEEQRQKEKVEKFLRLAKERFKLA